MRTIFLTNGYIGKQPVIRLEFAFDFQLKELVKSYPGCQWDLGQKVWLVPHTEDQLNSLLHFFKGKAWLDYSRIQTLKPGPSHGTLPPLTEVNTGEVNAFIDWMRNKRYSENTIKSYGESISIFLRYLKNKALEDIDNGKNSTKHTSLNGGILPLSKTRSSMR